MVINDNVLLLLPLLLCCIACNAEVMAALPMPFTNAKVPITTGCTRGTDKLGECCIGSIQIDSSLVSIASSAFYQCSELISVDFTHATGLTSIGNYAFSQCSSLKGVLVIPDSVTYIGIMAFEGCSKYSALILGNGVTTIDIGAFQDCSGFTGTLRIPDSVTLIDEGAFRGCSGFTGNLIIPNSIDCLNGQVFEGCIGFTGTLVIPNSVTYVGFLAFHDCRSFTALIIGTNVTLIDHGAFRYCTGLSGDLVIPDSVTSIDSQAFANCFNFTGTLHIGASVSHIDDGAFQFCSGFTGELFIPNSVTYVGKNAFCYMSSIACISYNVSVLALPSFDGTTTELCQHTPYVGDDRYYYSQEDMFYTDSIVFETIVIITTDNGTLTRGDANVVAITHADILGIPSYHVYVTSVENSASSLLSSKSSPPASLQVEVSISVAIRYNATWATIYGTPEAMLYVCIKRFNTSIDSGDYNAHLQSYALVLEQTNMYHTSLVSGMVSYAYVYSDNILFMPPTPALTESPIVVTLSPADTNRSYRSSSNVFVVVGSVVGVVGFLLVSYIVSVYNRSSIVGTKTKMKQVLPYDTVGDQSYIQHCFHRFFNYRCSSTVASSPSTAAPSTTAPSTVCATTVENYHGSSSHSDTTSGMTNSNCNDTYSSGSLVMSTTDLINLKTADVSHTPSHMHIKPIKWSEISIDAKVGNNNNSTYAIGDGKFGTVYKAKWSNYKVPQCDVAIKLMKQLDNTTAGYVRLKKSAVDEINITMNARNRLTKDCTVKVYGIIEGQIPSSLCKAFGIDHNLCSMSVGIVMRMEPGLSLELLLHPKGGKPPIPLSLQQRYDILVGIIHGLLQLHMSGIIHGDIKPANILLRNLITFEVILSDFGHAEHRNDLDKSLNASTLQQTCSRSGTPIYNAPEKYRKNSFNSVQCVTTDTDSESTTLSEDGKQHNACMYAKSSRKTDIYSFAILCCEVLSKTNMRPFNHIKNEFALYDAVCLKKERPLVSDLITDIPSVVVDMIVKGYDEDRSKRPNALSCYQILNQVNEVVKSKQFDIFFSHAWMDKPFLKNVYNVLSHWGYRVWLDENDMGYDLQKAMIDGIERSSIVLVCASKVYQHRKNCIFELDESRRLNKLVIVLVVDENIWSWATSDFKEKCQVSSTMYVGDEEENGVKVGLSTLKDKVTWTNDESDGGPTASDINTLAKKLLPLKMLLLKECIHPSYY